ncbi:MAG: ComEC family competence protein [Bacteroidetes bacterium]|nr:ComEC family competence protein [Bacteroidota bacterium]
MNSWKEAPLVRLLLPFIAGIIAAVYFPFFSAYSIILICFFVVLIAAIVWIQKFSLSYKKAWWFGIMLYPLLFLLGYQLTLFKTEINSPLHFSSHLTSNSIVSAIICKPSVEKEKSLKVEVEIEAVKTENSWKKVVGHALVYIQKDSASLALKYGDQLLFSPEFKEIPAPQNPGEFNYKRFLSFHNIHHQAYLRSGQWLIQSDGNGNALLSMAIGFRDRLLQVLKDNHVEGAEYAVGAALLLGYEDKLDQDIISAYSSTGALHVLSVSGLHVAIVYMVFNWLLFFLDKIKYGAVIKAVILLVLLWLYSAITGLSPSVLRAATMFSFIIIARSFNRYTNIYNTLAASAFLLLIIEPYLIMEVGFQLSYLAVIGIVFLQPKIYQWFEFDSWLGDQIWKISAVSIAAQIATFPLGLHYFHQFPNYFLLSNLIVIPISTIIIYLGIAVFLFAKFSMISSYLAIAFSWAITFLNGSVEWVELLPFSLLQGISISVMETWLIYGAIVLIVFYFIQRKYNYLIWALSAVVIVLSIQLFEQKLEHEQKRIVVYNIPNSTAIDFIDGKSNVFFADTSLIKNDSRMLFHVKHNWWDLGLDNNTMVNADHTNERLRIKNGFFQFDQKQLLVLDDNWSAVEIADEQKEKIKLNYLLLSHDPLIHINDLQQLFDVDSIIFDSSNSRRQLKQWIDECRQSGQKYYDVSTNGALEIVL